MTPRVLRPPLPPQVRALAVVSLLNDVSSEMIYPLLPAFVAGPLRGGPLLLGWIEGAAESLAALVKLYAGRLSDRLGRRKPLAVIGYGLATAARPWVALAESLSHVLAVRLVDRLGKGLRSAPRDALIAAVTVPAERGRAFGFHRAMDHAGALVGPLLAAWLLTQVGEVRVVFALAALPGILSLLVLCLAVDEPTVTQQGALPRPPRPPRVPLTPTVRRLLWVLALFTLGNSADVFLLLRAQEAGVPLAGLPLLWSFHHLVKSVASTPLGALSDRWGRRRTIAAGWLVYGLSYAGLAVATSAHQVVLLFALYGLHHALTEGPEKALLAALTPASAHGAAFGSYHAVTGLLLLPASVLTGWLWQSQGAAVALALGATLALTAAALLLALVPEHAELEPVP